MPQKHTDITHILQKLIQQRTHSRHQIEQALSKVQWSTQACVTLRPFLQPFYAWLHSTPRYGRPNKTVANLAQCMLYVLHAPPTPLIAPPSKRQATGATDAMANNERAHIGGWYTTEERYNQCDVQWFSLRIDKQNHPWAYVKASPNRHIAALELYATMLLYIHILHTTDAHAQVDIPIRTDNQGNAYNIINYKSRKWPSSAMLMEIALQQHYHKHPLRIQHVYRDYNDWADKLSNGKTEGFDPSKQIKSFPTTYIFEYLLHSTSD